jgi:hypothetical protein
MASQLDSLNFDKATAKAKLKAETSPTLDVTQLKYLHFNTSTPGQYINHCNSAYELWKTQWVKTFEELGVDKKLTSDDFLNRQLCGLFKNEEAIGFILYQNVDFNLNASYDTLYFHNYTSDLVRYQKIKKDQAFIISYMTLNPQWRKTATNFSISELLISFVVLEFNFSNAKRIIGYFRNNRSTNQIFYRHAGHFLSRKSAYNVDVDFAEIEIEKSHLSTQKDHAILSLKLWDIFQNTQQTQNKKETTHGTQISHQQQKHEFFSPKSASPGLE